MTIVCKDCQWWNMYSQRKYGYTNDVLIADDDAVIVFYSYSATYRERWDNIGAWHARILGELTSC